MIQARRILPVVFLVVGAVLAAEKVINQKLKHVESARNVFINSVSNTKARLVNGAWQIANDAVLLDNLVKGNINTLGQSLQNNLRPGEITQIEIVDSECNLVVRTPQNASPFANGCKKFNSDAKLFWQESSSKDPVLSVQIAKTLGGKKFFIQAHVVWDQAWTSVYPELSALLARHEVSLFSSSRRGLIWEEGALESGANVLNIVEGGWLSRFFPDFTKFSLNETLDLGLMMYGMMSVLIFMLFLQLGVKDREDALAKEMAVNMLKDWRTKFRFGEEGAEADLKKWSSITNLFNKYIEKIAHQKDQQLKLMRERQDKNSLAAVERDRDLADLQEKLSGMSDLASLKEQLQHSSNSFLNKMQEVRSHCEDIFDVASTGLATSSKSLQELTKRWQGGVDDLQHRERGARKFFRTLSETRGSRPGTTKLDDELLSIEMLSNQALDQSLHIAMLSRQVLAEIEAGVHVAALWQGLAMRDFQRDTTCDWKECLISAQRLVGADPRYATLTFETMPQVATPEELYLPIARVSLISGLFHLYMALLADVTIDAISLPIVLRQKRFADQGTLILSLPHPAQDIADSAAGRGQQYHMELAKAILGPSKIKVSFLPPTVAGVPVALMWPLPGKQMDLGHVRSRESNQKSSEQASQSQDQLS